MSDAAAAPQTEGAPTDGAEAAPAGKPSLKQRYKALVAEYGALALATWFTIFFTVWAGFAAAIKLGYQPEGASAEAGTWFSAYLATQLTKPVRFVATLALTPLVARVWHRVRGGPEDGLTETISLPAEAPEDPGEAAADPAEAPSP
jgi:hypothetical protein